MAGAWRSLRYDLDRRQARGADDEETTDLIFPEYSAARPPRRMLAAGGFGLLAVAGAAGTYLAVASGLGLLIDDPSGQNALPSTAGNPAAVQDFGGAGLPVDEVVPPDGVIGVGKGDGKGKGEIVVVREGRKGGRITPAGQQAAVEEAGGDHVPAPGPKPSPTRTKPTFPGPGPTTTRSPSPSPSVSPSASASPSASPSPSPSETPSPSPSASDPGEGGGSDDDHPEVP